MTSIYQRTESPQKKVRFNLNNDLNKTTENKKHD